MLDPVSTREQDMKFRTIGILAATAGLAACASLPQDKLDERNYRNFDYREQFKYDRAQCVANGGTIVTSALARVGRDGIPKHRERYFCV